MAFQIVGIGDWHQKSTSHRNAARMKALDQILQEGTRLPALAAWLQLGDVYDSRSTVEDRNTVAGTLVAMAQHAPVIVVGGNHCAPGDLDVLGKLASRWPIYVVTSPRVVSLTLATGQPAHVACLPYPHRASLVAAGTDRSEMLDAGMQALQDTCHRLATELTQALRTGGVGLLAAHVNVEGSIASNGQPSVGKELSITTAMLRMFGDVPQILGHIHLPQQIGTAHYVGSVSPCDWGETEQKRYVTVSFDDAIDGRYQYVIESHPLDIARMWHVDGEYSRESGFRWRVRKGPGGAVDAPPATWAGAEVRVRYQFAASERGLFDDSGIRETFKDATRLEIEPIAVPDRGLRAPEVQAARTLSDKLGAWARLNNSVTPDGVYEKLAALEHDETGSVLAAVTAHVDILEHGPVAAEKQAA
jgi:DNA repair exonuclease SbcCD nuclease subunit